METSRHLQPPGSNLTSLHVKAFRANTEGRLSVTVNPMQPSCIEWNYEDLLSLWNLFGLNINYNAADVSPILLSQWNSCHHYCFTHFPPTVAVLIKTTHSDFSVKILSVLLFFQTWVYLLSSIHFFFRVPKHLGKLGALNRENKSPWDVNAKHDVCNLL